jgi:transcription elongation factor Elf1
MEEVETMETLEEEFSEDALDHRVEIAEEYEFDCPHCWEKNSIILDMSVEAQSYIEDCTICCNPIEISYRAEDGLVIEFDAKSIEQ